MTQQVSPSEVARIFDAELREPGAFDGLPPRFNVAPTQPLTVVVGREDGRVVEQHRWGLVPSWSKSVAQQGARLINARAETVARSGAFRESFLRRRCIVPADGFYEWRREGRRRDPFLIRPADGSTMAFAGLWAAWKDPASGEWLLSAAVVTTAANGVVGLLHDRMPVVLSPGVWEVWLDPMLSDAGLLESFLAPAPDELLELVAVSPLVNSPHNEGPELLLPPPPRPEEAALTLFG
ncbi:MAG TPA: SOS response-associated peptidase [Candidatus Limnocylindria bacterium]|nr:SOS response-associated peptidase [Candidatus Limnocylindria bacterium]